MLLAHLYTWSKIAVQLLGLKIWYWRNTSEYFEKSLQLLRNENILFTKIFQSLAHSKYEHYSPELKSQLMHYTSNTSYTESEIDYETLTDIERSYNLQIDRRVVNSGMIALVFKGIRSDGEQIIVKIKRKGIRENLHKSCESVKFCYTYAIWWNPRNMLLKIIKPFIDNMEDIMNQCDFGKEISNLRQAKRDFASLSCITIPTVYNVDHDGHDSNDPPYILMNYIDGIHSLPNTTTDEQRFQYLEYFCKYLCFGFVHNTIQHTDLHSGNILFTPTGLGIIDFGMAVNLTHTMHDMILSCITLIIDQQQIHEIDFIDTFKDLFVPPLDKATIPSHKIMEIEDICISITEPLTRSIEFDEVGITDDIQKLSTHLGRNVVLHKDLYKIMLGMTMMGNNAVIMGPNYPHIDRVRDVEERVLRETFVDILLS